MGRRLLTAAFGLMALGLCYSALASNRRVLHLLFERYS